MKDKDFQLSISGCFLAGVLLFSLGLIVGVTIAGTWESVSANDLIASAIALLALTSTLYFSWSQRRHNRLQVKPHLIIKSNFSSRNPEGYFSFFLKIHNYGLGPAIIKKTSLWLDSKAIGHKNEYKEWIAFACKNVPESQGGNFVSESAYSGEVIDRGQTVTYLAFSFKPKDAAFIDVREKVIALAKLIKLEIVYEDNYGTEFKSRYKTVSTNA